MKNELGFSDADRLYLKSLCLYYNGNLEETLKLLGEALELDPSHNHSLTMEEKVGKLVVKDGKKCFLKQFSRRYFQFSYVYSR